MELFSNLGLSGLKEITSKIFTSIKAAPAVIRAVDIKVSEVEVSCLSTRPVGGNGGICL